MSGKVKRPQRAAAGVSIAPAANLPPVPPPKDEYAEYAQVIAVTIGQGVPGDMFADLVNAQNPELVRKAAAYTFDECLAWFNQTQSAAEILNATPGFDVFVRAFHARALATYPKVSL